MRFVIIYCAVSFYDWSLEMLEENKVVLLL